MVILINTIKNSIKFNLNNFIWSGNGIRGSHLNATQSRSISNIFDQNIALHSPFLSPRIFHVIIFFSIFSSVADCQNTMVKLFSTLSWINSWFIKLESSLISLYCYWNWSMSYSSFKSFFRVDFYLGTITNSPGFISISTIMTFQTKDSFIWIFFLCGNSMILDIEKWLIHQTTKTSIIMIRMRTIHKLLLWKWD